MSFLNNGISRTHIAAIAVCALAISTLPSLGQAQQNKPTSDPPIVIHWRGHTVLSKSDKSRLFAIQSALHSRHTVTDDDLNFALNKLKAEPVVRKGHNKLELQCMVLTMLGGRKDFTKRQASRFLQAVVPFASSANSSVASYATLDLGGLRDARVIPILEKIVQNTNSNKRVRQYAASSVVLAMFVASSVALAQPAAESPKQQVLKVNSDFFQAFKNSDVTLFDKTVADDAIFTADRDETVTKEQTRGDFSHEGPAPIKNVRVMAIKVRESTAVVVGRMWIKDEVKNEWYQYTNVFIQSRDKAWRLIASNVNDIREKR